jgi:hypothetical protein
LKITLFLVVQALKSADQKSNDVYK